MQRAPADCAGVVHTLPQKRMARRSGPAWDGDLGIEGGGCSHPLARRCQGRTMRRSAPSYVGWIRRCPCSRSHAPDAGSAERWRANRLDASGKGTPSWRSLPGRPSREASPAGRNRLPRPSPVQVRGRGDLANPGPAIDTMVSMAGNLLAPSSTSSGRYLTSHERWSAAGSLVRSTIGPNQLTDAGGEVGPLVHAGDRHGGIEGEVREGQVRRHGVGCGR